MIRKLSVVLLFLLLMSLITPLDNGFIGSIYQPDPAYAQSALMLDDFALYSQNEIKLDQIADSRGSIGSNGHIDIKKGVYMPLIGTLQAVGRIKNEAEIGIYGDVFTAQHIEDRGTLTVSGQKIENATLAPLALPTLSFSAAGADLEVPELSSMTIAPGSYGRLKLKKGAAILLTGGTYYFVKFEIEESAAINLDVTGGAITINVVEKIKIREDVDMQIVGGGPQDVRFNFNGTDKVDIEDRAVLRGILTAPSAKVDIDKGGRLEGAVRADSIHLAKGASFRHYAAALDGRPPTADAGGHQTALAGGQVQLDGSGSSDPDGDAITYQWSFVSYPGGSNPVLSDPTAVMPTFTADLAGAYVIELSVHDGTYASFKDSAFITTVSEVLDVTDFVLYADDKIKIDEISGGTGEVGANRHVHIEKGPSGAINGDLRVVDHIKNDGEITINGDVVTNSPIDNHGVFTVTGMTNDSAQLAARKLPSISFSAEGPDLKVDAPDSQVLDPGSYGRVEVKKDATLQFAAGSYFLRELKTDDSASLIFEASEGGIELNIVNKLEIGKDVNLHVLGGGTRDVQINYAGKKEVEIEDRSVLRGTLVAPKAKVQFEKESRLEGAVYAKNIEMDKQVSFQFHTNRSPLADPQTIATGEDTAVLITLSGSDPDDDSLNFAVISQPQHGTLSGTAPDLTYMPGENFNGADTFSFTVNDGTVDSDLATVNITVAAVNDAPVAAAQNISLNEDESKPVVLVAFDVEGDTLAYEIVGQPSNGTLAGTTPDLIYTPHENYNGADAFSFKVNDGNADSNPATVSIAITAVNDAPIANPQSISLNEDQPKPVVLTALDVEGDALSYAIIAQPSSGTLSGTAPDLTYTPGENYNGADAFSFTVNDGTVDSDPATVNITVTAVNDAPVANAQNISLNEDESKPAILTALDVEGDALSYTIVGQPTHGMLSGTAPDLTYTPDENFNGNDAFSFTVNDGTVDSDPATVGITVAAVNDMPIANPQSISLNEDESKPVTLNGFDAEGDALAFAIVAQPSHGSLSGTAPDLTYTPGENFNGADSFSFTVNDGTVDSDPATVNITVAAVNDAPVANAQNISLNEDESKPVALTALDVEGDALSYAIVAQPSNGTLSGTAPDLTYTPSENFNGVDAFSFTVNDGAVDSYPATVTITVAAVNDAPVAAAGSDQTVFRADAVSLNGSGSTDVDGDDLTYQWSFSSVPAVSTAALSDPLIAGPSFVPDIAGSYTVQLIVNDGTVDSAPDAVTITANLRVVVVPDVVGLVQADAEAALIVANLTVGAVSTAYSDTIPADQVISQAPTAGASVEEASAVDLVVSLGPESLFPTVSLNASPAIINRGEAATLSWTATNAVSVHIDNGIGPVNPNATTTVSPEHTTIYTITASGAEGNASNRVKIEVHGAPDPQPEGSFGQPYEDLVPLDATADSYDPKRFSLITGLIQDLSAAPVADVAVSIHNHPEYGTATSDIEGRFSMPVEGGSTITIVYQKPGLIKAHRNVYVPWNDIAIAETIQMVDEDPVSTTLTFDGNPATVVTHQSTRITDEFGSRSATLVFTGDNRAYLVDENGHDVQELATITTRATEFTTPESMPAELPPNSAYTYCAELSVDGVQRVRFDKPVISWIDNFLGFDVGMAVPVGYYDRDQGLWVPADNGTVVRLLDTDSDGITDALDADGDDQPDDLNGNGSFSDEVLGLADAQIYAPGSTFWRVGLTHFTPWDWNWPFGFENGAIPPNSEGEAAADTQCKGDCPQKVASYIEARSRIFHEDISIPGTGIKLHYAGDRVNGYRQVISVPASGDTVPANLKRIVARVEVAGRSFEQILDPLPDQIAEFIWDGRDHLGRPVHSPVTARVSVGFAYDAVYLEPGDFARSFAQAGSDITRIVARRELYTWKRSRVDVAPKTSGNNALAEGWTISNHHQIAPSQPWLLLKGDGTTSTRDLPLITTVAGSGLMGYSGDGGPATDAKLAYPVGLAVDGAGNLYIAEWNNHTIRKVDTSGVISTVAGTGTAGYSGDGGPATAARLRIPYGVAVDGAGNIFIAEYGNHCIRKVDAVGTITTVAGNGSYGYSGDGGLAIAAQLNYPRKVAVDAVGNLYIVDGANGRIRKVDTNGIITTVAGNGPGNSGTTGEGQPAVEANLGRPLGLAVDPAGNLFISDWGNNWIRKVDTSGIVYIVAGTGARGYSGDGGFATAAWIAIPYGLGLDAVGNLYIADSANYRIRKVDTGGFITTVAGSGTSGDSGDGGHAIAARIQNPYDVAVDAAGNIYIADFNNQRVRKVAPPSAAIAQLALDEIPFTENSGLGHIFSISGVHKRTVDLETGLTLRSFSYDEDDRLLAISDRFGNTIHIERDIAGVPLAVISPEGIRTDLTIDADNHLTRVTYPDGKYYSFEYTPDGLMTAEVEPAGNRFDHDFSQTGRLTDAYDEQGGRWNYQRTASADGDILTRQTTGEGNVTTYLDRTDSTGAYTSTITGPAGSQTLFTRSADGLSESKSSDCGMELEFKHDVDSEYNFQFLKQATETSPSGLARVVERDRAYQNTDADDIPDIVTATIALNGKITTFSHNIPAAEQVATSPEGRTVTSLYNPDTLLTESVLIPGLYDTSYEYDARGRLTRVSTHTRQTALAYNPEGWLASVTDAENRTTGYSYDDLGRVTAISRPDGSYIDFDYDANGNLTLLTNPGGIEHGFGFNSVNRNSSYQTPLSGSYSYVYDKDRRLIRTNYPSGKSIVNDYADPANPADKSRLWQIITPEGNIDFTYLCGSRVESISNGSESIAYSYDGDLVTSETLSGTLNLSMDYTYNNDFNVAEVTYAGETVSYTYDNDGLLTGAGNFTIWRNVDNGLAESVTGSALNLSRTFNGYGEVDSQNIAISGQDVAAWSLTRDNNGRIASKTETVNGVTSGYEYTYDDVGRLLTVVKDGILVEEYGYDLSGTRISETNTLRGIAARSFSYSDEDHLLSAGSVTYAYDPDGFLTTKTDGSDVTDYTYSSRGELLNVALPDGTVVEYVNDPLGRRIAKKVDGAITEKYLWQGLTRLLAVYDGSDNLLLRFEYTDSRMPLAMTSGGNIYYLSYDQVSSLKLVVDSAGNVIKSVEYDSFGNIINDSNPTFTLPFGFAGGVHDRDTGLVRFGYRDYDPDIGRWTAKDPIFFAGGDADLYGYVLNDPINFFDPDGLSKTKGITTGGTSDPYYHRLKEANGDRQRINAIENEAKAKKDAGEIKGDRWKKIKAWIKLAKDGRLYIRFPVFLFEFQEKMLEYPPGTSLHRIIYIENEKACGDI